jgi:uncharacterized protein YciI
MTTSSPPRVDPVAGRCFLVLCRDGENAAALRAEHLEGHLRHVEKHWQRYVTAGPLREPGAEAICGSLFLILADNREDAKALMQGDPYVTSGLYRSTEYLEFTNAIGRFLGGKIWEDAASIAHRAAGVPTGSA